MGDETDKTAAEIKKLIVEYSPIEGLEIEDSSELDHFGLDSIDFMEIAFSLEETFSIELQIEKLKELTTFGQFVEFVVSETRGA